MASVNVPDAQAPAPDAAAAPPIEPGAATAPSRTERLRGWGTRLPGAAGGVRERLHPLHVALLGVIALAAALDFNRLSRNGFANIFYSAAVKSELHSLHNFVFLSSDPAGYISVDKTPLGVWLQVASANLFGFSPDSLLIPEAVVAVLAVVLLYGVVARRFGRVAGLCSAAALAVFPSFVAVARDNGPDPLLILFMLIACGSGLRAVETSRLRWLIGSAVAVGLAFNTKGLAALLVVPGIAVAYLVCADVSVWRRVWHLLMAGVLMVAISGAWIAFVDLTPASKRPYVGGSTNNTELNLTFSYNGFGRVGGQVGGPGRVPHVRPLSPALQRALSPVPPIPRVGHARFPTAFTGAPRIDRLFGVGLGDQGGWYLPFAFLGLLAVALTLRRRRDPRLAFLIVLGGWFAIEAIVLDFSKGIVHPYYIAALAPGAAAMLGAGAVSMAELMRERRWLALLPVLAAGATFAVQEMLLRREHWHTGWVLPLAVAATAAVLVMAGRRRWSVPAVAALVIACLVVPAAYSATTWNIPVEGTFPAAGPHIAGGHGGYGVSAASVRANRALLAYIHARGGSGSRLDAFTLSSDIAAPMTLLGGRGAAIGGYSGSDPALTGPGLARMVAAGEVRFLWLGGAYAERGGNAASRAAEHLCTRIPARVWLGTSRSSLPLFDCGGRAHALATAGARCPAACESPVGQQARAARLGRHAGAAAAVPVVARPAFRRHVVRRARRRVVAPRAARRSTAHP